LVRPFRTPGGVFLPVLGVISCAALLVFLPAVTLLRYALYMGLGLAVYFAYSARASARRTLGQNPL
jgi:basic amino acid/polyamine antiporter, APA family